MIHIEGGPDMTLDEVNRIGEIVTENLDQESNVIWGARVSEDMKGKLTVMTIITGVHSPWILGKIDEKSRKAEANKMSNELGIDFAH
jgi:cell division protein FtsZ